MTNQSTASISLSLSLSLSLSSLSPSQPPLKYILYVQHN